MIRVIFELIAFSLFLCVFAGIPLYEYNNWLYLISWIPAIMLSVAMAESFDKWAGKIEKK